jgi:uncharacterized protein YndB with AHSA1/START domain
VYQSAVLVAAAPEVVFRVLLDHRTFPEWMTGLVRCRRRSRGPARIGTRTELVLAQAGLEVLVLSEIVELEPERALAVRFSGEGIEGLGRHRLTAVRGRTRIHHELQLGFKGTLGLARPLVAGFVRRKVDADLAALKRLLEPAS